MRREILFRGKRLDSGKWTYGYYTEACANFVMNTAVIETNRNDVLVERDTIGQYTGLTDKNGIKIFEGDIVHILGNQDVEDWKNVNYNALITFLDGGFCAIDGTEEEHGFRRYSLCRMDFDLEVIGNIHDNPELLAA